MAGPRPKAILVDDHQVFLDGLALVMSYDRRLEVAARASTAAAAIAAAKRLQPELVVLDVDLDGVPAQTTLRRILRAAPATRVAILTMHASPVLQDVLLRSGAAAFISKTLPGRDVVNILVSVCSRPVPAVTVEEEVRPLLTTREREVLRLVALAMSNRQISEQLSITEGTVKRHASSAYVKLGATSRVDAARKAGLLGLI